MVHRYSSDMISHSGTTVSLVEYGTSTCIPHAKAGITQRYPPDPDVTPRRGREARDERPGEGRHAGGKY